MDFPHAQNLENLPSLNKPTLAPFSAFFLIIHVRKEIFFSRFPQKRNSPYHPLFSIFAIPIFLRPFFYFYFQVFFFYFLFLFPSSNFHFPFFIGLFFPLPLFRIFLFLYQACPRNTRRGSSSTEWRGTLTASMTSAPRRMQAPSLASKKRKPRRYRQRRLLGLLLPRPKIRHMQNQKRWMQHMAASSVTEK